MKKSIVAIVFTMALLVIFSWIRPVEADTWSLYEDFTGTSIDSAKWTVYNNNFSYSLDGSASGNLELSGYGAPGEMYTTPRANLLASLDIGSVRGAMLMYSDYTSSNTTEMSSGVYLGAGNFGDNKDFYIIERLTNATGNFIWAGHVVGTTATAIGGFSYTGDSGALGLWAGGEGLVFAHAQSDYSNPASWTTVGYIPYATIYATDVMMIGAIAGANGFTSVKIESVYVKSIPEPVTLMLLGLGLAGLAGLRRKINQ